MFRGHDHGDGVVVGATVSWCVSVCLCVCACCSIRKGRSEDGKSIAVKIIRKAEVKKHKLTECVDREVAIARRLHHDFVTDCADVLASEDKVRVLSLTMAAAVVAGHRGS